LILALSASPATAVKADQIKVELDKLLNDLDCRVIVPRPQDLRPFWNRPQVSYLLKELNDYQKHVRVESFELRPRLHYTGLHWSVAIFIPDSAAVYTTPQ
jgi:hypothetical protein